MTRPSVPESGRRRICRAPGRAAGVVRLTAHGTGAAIVALTAVATIIVVIAVIAFAPWLARGAGVRPAALR